MAVMRNSINFGGIDSADFGIYISGEGVFNSPKRAVEMVEVPGRNGAVAIDQGRWENIEVTYPAFNKEGDLATFAQQLSDFRNALASQVGYQRLTDTFHPDEYRMAMFADGLEIEPVKYNTASEFELKFNCKPQRWLTSGEIPVTIGEWGATKTASGEIVTIESEGGEAAKSLEVSLEPIQAGSGEPSPSNVRAISGRTEVVTRVAGKNLYEALTSGERTNSGITWAYNSDGSVTASGTATGNSWSYGTAPHATLKQGTYTVSVKSPFGLVIQNITDGGYFYNGDNSTATFTVSKETIVGIHARVKNGTTINQTTGIMLEVGSSASEWTPYNGNTYTTALGRTVYGGTLDVVSGVLTVDRAMLTLNGSETWTASNGTATACMRVETITTVGFKRNTSNTSLVGDISSAFVEVTPNQTWGGTIGFSVSTDANPHLHFCQTGQKNMSVEAWKTYLASNPIQVVGFLATPQTYQLTPQQVTLLLGENHVLSDGAITMQYGDDPNSLYNPTPYDAGPLLAVKGYGTIGFNGHEIELNNEVVGELELVEGQSDTGSVNETYASGLMDSGDTITLVNPTLAFRASSKYSGSITQTIKDVSVSGASDVTTNEVVVSDQQRILNITFNGVTFSAHQAGTFTQTFTVRVVWAYGSDGGNHTVTYNVTVTFNNEVVDATHDKLTMESTSTASSSDIRYNRKLTFSALVGDSTQSVLGDPTYIDCEIGEAYKLDGDTVIGLNKYIELGSDLPTLASGGNEITYNGSITELKITPNWWKL